MLFKIIIILITLSLENIAMDKMPENSFKNIQEVVPNKIYATRKADDLWFIAEKLGQDNVGKWREYIDTQLETQVQLSAIMPSSKMITYAIDGLRRFKEALPLWSYGDLWVVYALASKDLPDNWDVSMRGRVEMSYILSTSSKSPFTFHMGISRGMEHTLANRRDKVATPFHPDISIDLHAFGAAFARMYYRPTESVTEKKYMITVPIKGMYLLLSKALPPHTFFLGDNLLKIYLEKQIYEFEHGNKKDSRELVFPDGSKIVHELYTEYLEVYKQLLNHPSPITLNHNTRSIIEVPEDFRWTLSDGPNGAILLEITKQNYAEYLWFFGIPNAQPQGTDAYYVIVDLNTLASHSIKQN